MICFRPPLCLQPRPPVALLSLDSFRLFTGTGFVSDLLHPEAWNLEVSQPKGCGIPGTGSSILAECEAWGKASCWLGMGQVCRLTLKEQKYDR